MLRNNLIACWQVQDDLSTEFFVLLFLLLMGVRIVFLNSRFVKLS